MKSNKRRGEQAHKPKSSLLHNAPYYTKLHIMNSRVYIEY